MTSALLESPHAASVPSAYSIRLMLANAPLYNLAPRNFPKTAQLSALSSPPHAAGRDSRGNGFFNTFSAAEGYPATATTMKTLCTAPHAPSYLLWDASIDCRGRIDKNRQDSVNHHNYSDGVADAPAAAHRRATEWAGCFSQEESRQLEAARRSFAAGPFPFVAFHNRDEPLIHDTSPTAALPGSTPACGNQLTFISQSGTHSLAPPVASPSPCRPFACAICGAKFASLQALGGHKSAHRDGGAGKAATLRAVTTICNGGKRRRELSPEPPLLGLYSLYKDESRMRSVTEFGVGESPPQQPAFFEATRNLKQPVFEATRNQPSSSMNACAARPPRLTRIDSSTRCGSSDTRHSGGNQFDGNQNSNQSGNQNGSNQSGGNQSRSSDSERAAILANIRQELGRLKRQKVSHVAAGTNAGSTSLDESDADVAARSGARGACSGASDAAMAAREVTPNVTKENHGMENEQAAATQNVKNAKSVKNVKNEKKTGEYGKEVEVIELDLFCSTGADTDKESGSSEGSCGGLQSPLCTPLHPPAPAPVLDLALHL